MNLVDDTLSRTSDLPPGRPTPQAAGSLIRAHMPGIDLLRGVAILSVVLYHGLAFSAPNITLHNPAAIAVYNISSVGWAGVNLFFALSGFLITGNLVDGRHKANFYSRFYLRRALRILPVYFLVLLALLALHLATPNYAVVCALFLANMAGFFLHGFYRGYAPLWSLAVEEQFYLCWPWLYRRLHARGLIWLCIAIMLLCPILRAAAIKHVFRAGDPLSKTWMIGDNLAVGALVALLVRTGRITFIWFRNTAITAAILSGMGLLAFACLQIDLKKSVFGGSLGYSLLECLCAALVALALIAYRKRALWAGLRWLVFFGDISYGLYLLHMLCGEVYDRYVGIAFQHDPRALLLRFFITNTVAVLVATLSKRWFENPILRLKNRIPAAA